MMAADVNSLRAAAGELRASAARISTGRAAAGSSRWRYIRWAGSPSMSSGHNWESAADILRALADVSDDAIVVTDLDACVQAWSPGAARLSGYTAEAMAGQSLSRLWPEQSAGSLTSSFQRLRDGHRVEQFEAMRVAKGGRFVDVAVSLSPIRDADGRVTGALSIARDIRNQRRSEAALITSQARWRALLESAVDGIVVINARGRIEAFNPAAERLFGYAEHEVVGRNVNVLMPSPYHEEHDGYLARYLREGDPRIIGVGREVIGRRRDGSTFPVHLAVGEMSLDGERKFTGILHDLSSRVHMEGQLREQAALVHLGEMAAVIAHEVKNPLAGIRGAIQVIGGRMPPGTPEAGITTEIVARIDALSELMKDLLLFARPPKPNRSPVLIPALITETAALLTSDPTLADLAINVVGAAPAVNADAGLLKIVFANLLANGAHAMKGKGHIQIAVAGRGDDCIVEVRDEGPGIPPGVREKVFTPFFTTKTRGTGLGLPTAKRLIEAHHGNIAIICPSQGGTVVTVTLPIAG
jgi:two-component system sensor kinase FixL